MTRLPNSNIKVFVEEFSWILTVFGGIGIVTFAPMKESGASVFQDYIQYFLERERAGVISLLNASLYLLPPCEKAFAIHKFGNNQLLGVIVDHKEIQAESLKRQKTNLSESHPQDNIEKRVEYQSNDEPDIENDDDNIGKKFKKKKKNFVFYYMI